MAGAADEKSETPPSLRDGPRVNPPVFLGAAAAVLLLAGGLQALQSASISAGLPQSVLVIAACIGLVKSFREDRATITPSR